MKLWWVLFWPGVPDFPPPPTTCSTWPKEQHFHSPSQLRSDISVSVIALFMAIEAHWQDGEEKNSHCKEEEQDILRQKHGSVALPKMKSLSNRIRILYSTMENMYLSLTRTIMFLQQQAFLLVIILILPHHSPLWPDLSGISLLQQRPILQKNRFSSHFDPLTAQQYRETWVIIWL